MTGKHLVLESKLLNKATYLSAFVSVDDLKICDMSANRISDTSGSAFIIDGLEEKTQLVTTGIPAENIQESPGMQ